MLAPGGRKIPPNGTVEKSNLMTLGAALPRSIVIRWLLPAVVPPTAVIRSATLRPSMFSRYMPAVWKLKRNWMTCAFVPNCTDQIDCELVRLPRVFGYRVVGST